MWLDERPSGGGRVEESVKKRQLLDASAKEAVIGYARLDVIVNFKNMRFGIWNPRGVETPQVSKLVQSFLTQGADRFSLSKAIPLVVRPSDVKMGTFAETYTPGQDETQDLPLLELSRPSAEAGLCLVAAGGQHRVEAVKTWVNMLKKQHSELVRARKNLEQQSEDTTTAMDIDDENRVKKAKRDALAETLALGGQWLVVLYDRGEYISHISTLD